MPPRPGSSLWDHKSDKDLLLAIIDNGALKGNDWKVISDKMVAKGYTFSHEACRQHFQKIRKESRNGSADSAQSTPTKPHATPGSSKRKGLNFADGPTADDEEDLTPSKRPKLKAESKPESESNIKPDGQENRQSAAVFKMEDMAHYVVDLEPDDIYNDNDGV